MDNSNTRYLHALCALRPRISALRLRALVEAAGSLEAAWNANDAQLVKAGWTDEARTFFVEHRSRWDVAGEAKRLADLGIALVPLVELNALNVGPLALLQHTYDPPLGLYVRGEMPTEGMGVAVVGSRKATPYGRTVTQELVRPLAARGLAIMSGLAYGIDAEAHRAALAVNGRTIAVLGSGIDEPSLYPRAHRTLAREIIAAGGSVIGEFPPGTGARAEYFPQRNRIIAGLSRAVVIVEAAAASGALITARLALAENREVLAVPGPITSPSSAGTNRLLREGAAPACSAGDILEALALEEVLALPQREQAPREAPPLTEQGMGVPASPYSHLPTASADRILRLLSAEPQGIDAVVTASTLPVHEVAAALSVLELSGHARDVGGKSYVRCSMPGR